jgi:hypothetical protein
MNSLITDSNEINTEYMKKTIKWAKILYYYTSIELKNKIHCFFGSSLYIDLVEKHWEKLEGELKDEIS